MEESCHVHKLSPRFLDPSLPIFLVGENSSRKIEQEEKIQTKKEKQRNLIPNPMSDLFVLEKQGEKSRETL